MKNKLNKTTWIIIWLIIILLQLLNICIISYQTTKVIQLKKLHYIKLLNGI
jgi:hypothetical protein